jgi:hypothetical protein
MGVGGSSPFTVPYLYVKKRRISRGFIKHVFYILGFVRFDGIRPSRTEFLE